MMKRTSAIGSRAAASCRLAAQGRMPPERPALTNAKGGRRRRSEDRERHGRNRRRPEEQNEEHVRDRHEKTHRQYGAHHQTAPFLKKAKVARRDAETEFREKQHDVYGHFEDAEDGLRHRRTPLLRFYRSSDTAIRCLT
jgi:hypothetical protein